MIPRDQWPDIMTAADVKRCLDWGHVRTYNTFNRPDFPVADRSVKRNKQITSEALWSWLNKEVKQ